MVELHKDAITDRNNWAFHLAKFVNVWGYKHLGISHLEMHEDVKRLRMSEDKKAVFLYTGLHKSLWETTGLSVALYLEKMPLPYAGMGDNLVKGKFFQSLAKRTGVFLIKRATNRREILASARMLKEYIMTFMASGIDVLVFPEGTRKSILQSGEYGVFFPSAFEALLEYEREKENILEHYPELSPHNTYIVPVNVDYSRIREDEEMIRSYKGKPRTLHILDSLKWTKKVGDTYIIFGKPIPVARHMDKNRKELSVFAREKCLELVKILPINIVSRAIVETLENGPVDSGRIEANITRDIEKLSALKERFRGFSTADSAADIIKKVARYEPIYRLNRIHKKNMPFYKMYADYIGHYFQEG
jgi:glycerol-3-phosphate O-acyltransferase